MAKAKKKTSSLLREQDYKYKIVLERIANSLSCDLVEKLDFQSFSEQKEMFDYQQEALQNGIKILHRYFVECEADKELFYGDYQQIPHENLDFETNEMFGEFYPSVGKRIEFQHFVNRMCFWMTTASGKSIVIIKLVELLNELMKQGIIPRKDIMFFTANEDLIDRFKQHIDEYNELKNSKIALVSLKEYESYKRCPSLLDEKPLFYYKSDLMSTENKINIVNFRDYLNGGNNYVILDEAHKGDKQESKRQNIFSILSQNGFLFNFSATFTDTKDIATTVYNLNSAVWTKKGYGKKIYLLQNDLKAFKDKTDLNERAKKKAVLKSLILLAFVKKYKINGLYHEPMIVALTNSVNTEDSDLQLFFNELKDCAKKIDGELFKEAKYELYDEFSSTEYLISDSDGETASEFKDVVKDINESEILQCAFNTDGHGNIEAIVNRNNPEEIAFKLDNCDKPFALIKIGDTKKWIKEKLKVKIDDSFADTGYFETIDQNSINILMGSRSFYEGWDSNRPNIMLFINIGQSEDAKKFVTQAIGRGLRIESTKNNRQRLEYVDIENKHTLARQARPLETLFVLSTNKEAITTILTEVKEASDGGDEYEEIELKLTDKDEKALYIPVYKKTLKKVSQLKTKVGFTLSTNNRSRLQSYIKELPESLFMLRHKLHKPQDYKLLKDLILKDSNFKINNNIHYKNFDFLIEKLKGILEQEVREFDSFKNIEDEIVSFKKIKVLKSKKDEMLEKIEKSKEIQNLSDEEVLIKSKAEGLSLKDAMSKYQVDSIDFDDVVIKKLKQHYYEPIIYSEYDGIDWIKNIVEVKSEVEFLKELFGFTDTLDKEYDWWMFSKLNETYDKIFVPYFKDLIEKPFYPDFVFWLKKGDEYTILFFDPKGTAYTEYEHKVDGFCEIFEEKQKAKVFTQKGMPKISVKLFLYNYESKTVGKLYERFWINKGGIKSVF